LQSLIRAGDIEEGLIQGASILHASGITPALYTQADATLRHVIGTARAAGVPVAFNLNYRGKPLVKPKAK
jgi:2-dehydro-3-deoxygluconokinase